MKEVIISILIVMLMSTISSAKVFGLECEFAKVATLKDGLKNATFKLDFVFDTEKKKYVVLGNNSMEDLTMIENDDGITLVEITRSGNVMTTTINVSDQNLEAVHSRNTLIPSGLIAQQYYGWCNYMGSQP